MDNASSTLATKKKVVLAFLLGIGSIIIALVVSYLGFNKMLTVVDELAAPNQKLKTLHNLYQRVTELEHHQRLDAIQNPLKPDQDFLKESNSLLGIVDTLKTMQWGDSLQLKRLVEVQRILHHRDSLFVKYLQLKSNSLRNKKLSKKFDTLANILSKNAVTTDTSVRTTHKKKTVVNYSKDSTVYPVDQKRSFFSRLFKKKQSPVIQSKPKEKITEEVLITVDTVARAKRNNSIFEATKLIKELGTAELTRRKKLATRELALLQTTKVLFSQMMDIVRQVESEEISLVRKNNESATLLFQESIRKMVLILIVFCLLAAVLVYFILIDIARSNYYKTQLMEEKEKAEELSQVKQRFLDNMSHEIRTPLQSIIGFTEQLLRKPSLENKSEVQAIYSSSEHLLHVVNEVLDYSRLDSGKLSFETKTFYLSEIVEEVTQAIKVQAQKKGLQFYFDAEESENFYVKGDPFRLKQILYNLLGNAVKFTKMGFVKLDFKTMTDEHEVHAQFKIIDTGIGINENEIDKIFQRFEQANPSIGMVYGGSGLGLTIVKNLIEAQQGKLKVSSSFGKGSEFTVELAFERSKEELVNDDKIVKARKTSAHVLVIDDDNSILQLCGLILKNAGIRYSLQNDPKLLYQGEIENTITHILMDVRLGDVDGFELSKILRRKIKPSVPIIAMSAMTKIKDDPGFNKAFDALLLKPFHADELSTILEQFSDFDKSPFQPKSSLETVKKLTLGDPDLLRSALSNFILETEHDVIHLEQFLKEKRESDVRNILHKMKGRIAQFGYLSVSASLAELESYLENKGSVDFVSSEIVKLKEIVTNIISETQDELIRLN